MRFHPRFASPLTWLLLGLFCLSPTLSFAQVEPAAAESEAQPSCGAERHVAISFADNLEPALQREIFADLASDLEPRGLTVCTAEESVIGTALADVRVERGEGARFSIEVFDRTTDKRVGRDVSLTRIPSNGRALAIAIAIDELLRASWAELALRVQPGPPAPVASDTPKATPKAPPAAPKKVSSAVRLGLEATYLGTTESFDAFGGAASVETLPFEIGWIEGRLGLTRALTRDVPAGDLSVLGGQAGLTLGACLALGAMTGRACLGARSELSVLNFRGDGQGSATGKSLIKAIVTEALVAKLSIALRGPWSLHLSSGAGTTLLGARITDGASTLTRIDGLMLLAGLGIGVDL